MERQSRSFLYRFILIAVLLVLALWQLYPTFNLSKLNEKQDMNFARAQEMSNLGLRDIKDALLGGNLETTILKAINDSTNSKGVQELAQKMVKLDDQITKNEKRAIKRGLDLQGGTYLVYEVDFVQYLSNPNVAKNPDTQLQQLLKEIDYQAKHQDLDLFDVLQSKFEAIAVPLNRYFGKKGDSDRKIISDLRKETENAIDRALQVLRNRIDQFGVSEPSITKQGSRRIVVELAGILDVNRAKAIIGKTAQLEFKLLREPEITNSILVKIDKLVKKRRYGVLDSNALAEVSAADTTKKDSTEIKEKIRDEKEVNLDELFGTTTKSEKGQLGEADTSISVDKDMFEENPFLAMLGNLGNTVAAPKQNMKAVDIILNYPEVQEIIPKESEFQWSSRSQRSGDKEWYLLYFLKKTPEITGDYIKDANVNVSGEARGTSMAGAGEAEVLMELNSRGAKDFARITGANIGKQLAIVLDNKVASAPQIRDRIPNGRASITGMRDVDEAKDLVVVLRAGALPARLESIQERTVGPSLGQDSIQKGQWSGIVGSLLVIIFMILYYRLSGIIADIALVLNILFVLAVLAAFHATLTLPGIAGMILMVGMAVDANVLIYERIREELRAGKTIGAAIDTGYKRAFVTILDSNLTTLLTALVLYQFGTGPIKGFAVTLSIGLIANMFTAIFVTRFVFDFVTTKFVIKKLSI